MSSSSFFFFFFGGEEKGEKSNEKKRPPKSHSLFRPFFFSSFFPKNLQKQLEEDPGERGFCVRGDDPRGRGERVFFLFLKKKRFLPPPFSSLATTRRETRMTSASAGQTPQSRSPGAAPSGAFWRYAHGRVVFLEGHHFLSFSVLTLFLTLFFLYYTTLFFLSVSKKKKKKKSFLSSSKPTRTRATSWSSASPGSQGAAAASPCSTTARASSCPRGSASPLPRCCWRWPPAFAGPTSASSRTGCTSSG